MIQLIIERKFKTKMKNIVSRFYYFTVPVDAGTQIVVTLKLAAFSSTCF